MCQNSPWQHLGCSAAFKRAKQCLKTTPCCSKKLAMSFSTPSLPATKSQLLLMTNQHPKVPTALHRHQIPSTSQTTSLKPMLMTISIRQSLAMSNHQDTPIRAPESLTMSKATTMRQQMLKSVRLCHQQPPKSPFVPKPPQPPPNTLVTPNISNNPNKILQVIGRTS